MIDEKKWARTILDAGAKEFDPALAAVELLIAEVRNETLEKAAKLALDDAAKCWAAAETEEEDGDIEIAEANESAAMGLESLAGRISALKGTNHGT